MTTTDQIGGSAQLPVQVLVTRKTVTLPMKGITTSVQGGKKRQVPILDAALAPKILRLTQTTQGCSHIKPTLQEHRKLLFLLNPGAKK